MTEAIGSRCAVRDETPLVLDCGGRFGYIDPLPLSIRQARAILHGCGREKSPQRRARGALSAQLSAFSLQRPTAAGAVIHAPTPTRLNCQRAARFVLSNTRRARQNPLRAQRFPAQMARIWPDYVAELIQAALAEVGPGPPPSASSKHSAKESASTSAARLFFGSHEQWLHRLRR